MNLNPESPYTSNQNLKFHDISTEFSRVYVFPEGLEVKIDDPVAVCPGKKKRGYGGNGHRVVDSKGVAHYIPAGWIHLYWMTKEGKKPFSF